MTDAVEAQESLEGFLKDEIVRMYQDVADNPDGEFHFFHGRQAAELFGYRAEWLDRAPPGAVASFAGVGNPHLRSNVQPGETILDLGSGAGLESPEFGAGVAPEGVDSGPVRRQAAAASDPTGGILQWCPDLVG